MNRLRFSIFLILMAFFGAVAAFTPHFVGYWQNFNNPAETAVRLTAIPAAYNVVNIAFADILQDGTVSFTLQGPPYTSNDLDEFVSDIKTLQAKGVKVLITLGGQNAIFSVHDAASEQKFVSSLEAIINQLHVDGVDYDLENGLTAANASYLVQATKQIKSDFAANGKTLIFALAPETINTWFQMFPHGKYDSLIQSSLFDWAQVQLYNSGCMTGNQPGSACYQEGTEDFAVSQADSTIRAWQQAGVANAASKYVLGFPASTNGASSGYMDPAVIKKAFICLRTGVSCASYVPAQTYPDIGGVMTWDVNWDAKNQYQFANSLGQCVLQENCSA